MSPANGRAVSRTCVRCRRVFTVPAAELRLGKTTGTFCSRECYRADQRFQSARCAVCHEACAACATRERQTLKELRGAAAAPGLASCRACGATFTASDWRRRRFCTPCWASGKAYAWRQPRSVTHPTGLKTT